MTTKFDAIVIGAGLGGLAAAAMLAQKGRGVLLIEQHNVPGGYATSFVRGRYEWEVALHELSGIGPPDHRGDLYRLLEYLGVTQHVAFTRIPELYRSVFPDLDLVLPVGREAYEETLCTAFPHDADGIRRFLNRVHDLARELARFTGKGGIGNPLTAPFRFSKTLRYLPAAWGTVLNRDVKDPQARAVISQYWGYFGIGPAKVAFLYFASALSSYVKKGAAYVKGRSQALSNAFVKVVEANGGKVLFNTRVQQITCANGRVTGVTTRAGEQFQAPVVISNADPITTCRNLLGDIPQATRFLRKLRPAAVAPSSFNVYMGVACPPEKLGLSTHENFLNADPDFDRHYESMRHIGLPGITLATCYNAADPDISPPGTTSMVLTTLYYGTPWFELSPEQYVETKNRIADFMIDTAERIAPGLRSHTEVVEVATPITNMRYTTTMDGSIYGFDNTPFYHTVLRMGHQGPLDGLFFAGAYTQPGGGFEPCIMSGAMAARMAMKQIEKAQEEV
ncbi:MAG: NAD(P)/FAD-dependent oxidoreductase [Bradymonadales bacterium]|nr:NAD(P)/FAD-dependent oxidoreductase [Bradymonadales bacterium]